jgi:sterol desaturase/sphingolipid hydroxylase (fatty acid hydroxylase superfamily)
MLDEALAVFQTDYVLLAVPVFVLALIVEWRWARAHAPHVFNTADLRVSLGVMLITVIVDVIPKFLALLLMFVCYNASPFKGLVGNTWLWWLLLFFLDDFIYYWHHRLNHEVRILWAGHVPHHNSEHYHFGTALRQGVCERVLKYFFWMPLPLLGFHPLMVVTMLSFSLIYQFWLHTQSVGRLPAVIEFVFNTPSHHRVHHGSNPQYLDRNHGGTLIIWDRLFGSFAQECDREPVKYGVTRPLSKQTAVAAAFDEYVNLRADISRASRLRDKIRYLFMAPGWSHDGEDKRSSTVRAKLGLS